MKKCIRARKRSVIYVSVEKKKSHMTEIVSIIALVVSLATFIYAIYRDNSYDKEHLRFKLNDVTYDEILSYNTEGGSHGFGIISGINYPVSIVNNSKIPITIESCVLERVPKLDPKLFAKAVASLKDGAGEDVSFPLTLDVGEGILLSFNTNTLISPDINMLMLSEYGTEANIDLIDLQDYLGERQKDIFNNEIKYFKYGDGDREIVNISEEFPIYKLEITTSKGNVFETFLSHQDMR